MGTRHLIAVQLDGGYKIAQYGQWDGNPAGQGVGVLGFLSHWDRPAFEAKLRQCRFLTDAEMEAKRKAVSESGLSELWEKLYPELSRNTGSDILMLVQNAEHGLQLYDNSLFATDSLMCEWAYVIDLDKNRLEVYEGFNKEPLHADARFAGLTTEKPCSDGTQYYQVRKIAEWPLDALPTVEELIAACDPEDADDA